MSSSAELRQMPSLERQAELQLLGTASLGLGLKRRLEENPEKSQVVLQGAVKLLDIALRDVEAYKGGEALPRRVVYSPDVFVASVLTLDKKSGRADSVELEELITSMLIAQSDFIAEIEGDVGGYKDWLWNQNLGFVEGIRQGYGKAAQFYREKQK